ncbi:hypothetical protein M2351_006619 [Azospirillum canadense]|nr:hypothetical protein [Azospirillum canadense]
MPPLPTRFFNPGVLLFVFILLQKGRLAVRPIPFAGPDGR